MLQEEKNRLISDSIRKTRDRRKNQVCRVYRVKVDYSSLSKKQKNQFKLLFLEAKWLANDIIAYSREEGNSLFDYKITDKVHRLDRDGNRFEYEFCQIGSQMKQSVLDQLKSNVRTLSALKKKGYDVGQIRFRSEVVSLNLKQYGTTYRIINPKKMKVQNISGNIRVNGLRQILEIPGIEYANGKLVQTPLGYYIDITTFIDKDRLVENKNGKTIGLDFGCSTSITTSEGEKIDIKVGESERLKRLQTKLSHQTKSSNRYYKTISLIRREYAKMKNRKDDIANKIVSNLLKYDTVVMQDEQIEEWKSSGHGKSVQHSILGRVKGKLKGNSNVVMLSKYLPTTKLYTECGTRNEDIKIEDRVFVCPSCGKTEDRDIHAAKNMIWLYENKVGMGRTNLKREQIGIQVAYVLGLNS